MSELVRDLQLDLVVPNLKGSNLETICENLMVEISGKLPYSERLLLSRLTDTKKMSDASIGNGIVMPHLQLHSLNKPFAVLATLKNAVDFGAQDNKPVQIIYLLLSPERDGPIYLRRLARVARLLTHEALKQRLLEAEDADTIRTMLMAPDGWMMAA